ncbi:DNA/RNA non-specific endonuclease [Chitinophaga tropicalis]|uniref:G protein gamma domain-containing protein n=1 Tax=Chitinophaga tropicalis TaxID=2683588 RepID=A0A7K1U2J8_9BACT|nr:DNA/RNA non-specific endonuclease [Chitinophaga tropicalis]MVT08568.1 hypothetical protein [Chitinophaga tropicalis]
MSHENINVQPDNSLSRATAQNQHSSGLSHAAVQPLQREIKDEKPDEEADLPHREVSAEIPPFQLKLTKYKDIEQSTKKGKFSWEKLKTSMDDDDETNPATAEGLGVKSSDGTQDFTTDIKWKPVHDSAGEGTEMEANLGPDHMLGTEPLSGAAKHWNIRTSLMKKISGQPYIAGHLLNHNLGGPGNDERNLTAIPGTINSLQSANIEEVLKKKVNDQHQFYYYKVAVTYTDDTSAKAKKANGQDPVPYASKITSSWSPIRADKTKIGAVQSVDINIPSPSSYDKEVNTNPGLTPIVAGDGQQALVDTTNDVILNNSGFLGIATKATAVIRKDMNELKAKYEKVLKELAVLKDDPQNQEKIDELMAEVTVLRAKNEELEKQNLKLAEEVAALSEISAEQREQIEKLKAELEVERETIGKLNAEIKNRDEQIQELKKAIVDLNAEHNKLKAERRKSHDRHVLEVEGLRLKYTAAQETIERLEAQIAAIIERSGVRVPEAVTEEVEAEAEEKKKQDEDSEPEAPVLTEEEKTHHQDVLDSELPFKEYQTYYYKTELYALYKKLTGDNTDIKDLTMNLMWKRIRGL